MVAISNTEAANDLLHIFYSSEVSWQGLKDTVCQSPEVMSLLTSCRAELRNNHTRV